MLATTLALAALAGLATLVPSRDARHRTAGLPRVRRYNGQGRHVALHGRGRHVATPAHPREAHTVVLAPIPATGPIPVGRWTR